MRCFGYNQGHGQFFGKVFMTGKRESPNHEAKTLEIMLSLFCRDHHGRRKGLCEDCSSLLEYARQSLMRCSFMPEKPTCARCTVHCYKPEMRDRVRQVMRHAGPRMTYRHPLIAIKHLIQARLRRPQRKEPANAKHPSE